MWEDEVNKGCAEIRAKIPGNINMAKLNEVWENFVVDLVTNKMPHCDDVAGIRICDKSRGGESQIRIEIWTKIKYNKDEKVIDKRLEAMKENINSLFSAQGFINPDIQIADRR